MGIFNKSGIYVNCSRTLQELLLANICEGIADISPVMLVSAGKNTKKQLTLCIVNGVRQLTDLIFKTKKKTFTMYLQYNK